VAGQGRAPLDPATEELLDGIDPGAPGIDALSLEELRASQLPTRAWAGPDAPLASTEDRQVAGPAGPVPVRIYTPLGDAPKPLVVFTFGGGFITGSIDIADGAVRQLAADAGAVVVSVGYRLAPEDPFPAGLDDADAVLEWAAAAAPELGADPSFVAVAGDSSGGSLAAALALRSRDRGGPRIAHQLLVYPVLDCDFSRPSYADSADGYFLTRAAMQRFWREYLARDEDRLDPYAAPLQASELAGLPPATIILCFRDPLRSEGEAYARRLADAGVPVTLSIWHDLVHAAFRMGGLTPRARAFVASAGHALRDAYAGRRVG
jgi:acetyl esterase